MHVYNYQKPCCFFHYLQQRLCGLHCCIVSVTWGTFVTVGLSYCGVKLRSTLRLTSDCWNSPDIDPQPADLQIPDLSHQSVMPMHCPHKTCLNSINYALLWDENNNWQPLFIATRCELMTLLNGSKVDTLVIARAWTLGCFVNRDCGYNCSSFPRAYNYREVETEKILYQCISMRSSTGSATRELDLSCAIETKRTVCSW
jgi:hypothetical protein